VEDDTMMSKLLMGRLMAAAAFSLVCLVPA
jgi:hypothetical protein